MAEVGEPVGASTDATGRVADVRAQTATSITMESEREADEPAIGRLCARVLGPGRFARTAYRVREGGAQAAGLGFTARSGSRVIGAIRFTEITVSGLGDALLLGPLVIDPDYVGQGWGRKLIARGLGAARDRGFRLVLLVGDLPYYERAGFRAVPPGQIVLPGPADPARLLAAELEPGVLAGYRGLVRPASPARSTSGAEIRASDPRGTR